MDILLSHPRSFSRRSQALSVGLIIFYLLWIQLCSFMNSQYPYPFLNKLPQPQVCVCRPSSLLLQACVNCSCGFFPHLCVVSFPLLAGFPDGVQCWHPRLHRHVPDWQVDDGAPAGLESKECIGKGNSGWFGCHATPNAKLRGWQGCQCLQSCRGKWICTAEDVRSIVSSVKTQFTAHLYVHYSTISTN